MKKVLNLIYEIWLDSKMYEDMRVYKFPSDIMQKFRYLL